MSASCSRCGQRLDFRLTWPKRRRMPLDPHPSAIGNVRVVELDDEDLIDTQGAPPGMAIVLTGQQLQAARDAGLELRVHHRATCGGPAPTSGG